MNLVNRYIVYEIVKFFILALTVVLCIFVAIDYLGNMDEFIESHVSWLHSFQYVLLKIPFITTQAMPVVLLMALAAMWTREGR